MILFAIALAAVAADRPPDAQAEPGQVSIDDAANGGLLDWQPVAGHPGELYVRDRTDRWYRVRLSAACERFRTFDAMSYTTDAVGSFDRFSTVRFVGAGPVACAVLGVVRADTPPQFDGRRR